MAEHLPLPPAFHAEELRAFVEDVLAAAECMEERARACARGGVLGPKGAELARKAQRLRVLAVKMGHDGERR